MGRPSAPPGLLVSGIRAACPHVRPGGFAIADVMIDIKAKIHDKFSVEFKVGFVADGERGNDFAINTWIFLPNSLDINPATYGSEDFYRDVKSNVRFITPIFPLGR